MELNTEGKTVTVVGDEHELASLALAALRAANEGASTLGDSTGLLVIHRRPKVERKPKPKPWKIELFKLGMAERRTAYLNAPDPGA